MMLRSLLIAVTVTGAANSAGERVSLVARSYNSSDADVALFSFRRCASPMIAYGAAWFARVDLFLATTFHDSSKMEEHDTRVTTVEVL